MKKKPAAKRPRSRTKKPIPKADPSIPPEARRVERKIATMLRKLISAGYPSCLDKRFVAAYDEIRRLFALYQTEVLAAYPHRVSCGASCGICCNHWPEDTYSFEIQIIADSIRRERPSEIKKICAVLRGDIDRLAAIKNAVDKQFSNASRRKELGDIDPYDVVLSSFYQFNRACPLLGKDGSCSIYAIRPFTCRVYVSFSPPELCRPDNILGSKARTYLLDLENDTSELFDQLHFMYDIFDGDTSMRSMLCRALLAN
jgi:Fe-S-cluster containining protein